MQVHVYIENYTSPCMVCDIKCKHTKQVVCVLDGDGDTIAKGDLVYIDLSSSYYNIKLCILHCS